MDYEVTAPAIDASSGIQRRLAVLHTKRKLKDSEIDEIGGQTPALLDAIVSLSCLQAAEVYKDGYRAPEGSQKAKAATLADMDPVAAWLEVQDSLDMMPVGDARLLAIRALDVEDMTPKRFGQKVKNSVKWMPGHSNSARFTQRRPAPMAICHPRLAICHHRSGGSAMAKVRALGAVPLEAADRADAAGVLVPRLPERRPGRADAGAAPPDAGDAGHLVGGLVRRLRRPHLRRDQRGVVAGDERRLPAL